MDPATLIAAASAIKLLVETLDQYTQGKITKEQALEVFEGTKKNHTSAWARFNAARGPDEQPSGT
jgi:hypothetical protein